MAEAYVNAKFHLDPSNRLAAVHQRHRQDKTGQDRKDRQRSDSTGRTVLRTVAEKLTVFIGRPFVKRFALSYQTVVCLSCLVLSVTLMYCGQTVGWTKMKLGIYVGLGHGYIALDGDPTPSPKRGT